MRRAKTIDSVLAIAMVVVFFTSTIYSFVSVVPWGEHDYYLSATALSSVSVALVVCWMVVKFRAGRKVSGSLGVLMLVISGFFLFVNAFTLRDLYGACVLLPENADFRALCDEVGKVFASATGDSRPELLSVARSGRFQYWFSARGADGRCWRGYGGRHGPEITWTIKRSEVQLQKGPSKTIESAFAEFQLQDPLIETNRCLRIYWDPDSKCWEKQDLNW